jgi:hypothetical protein
VEETDATGRIGADSRGLDTGGLDTGGWTPDGVDIGRPDTSRLDSWIPDDEPAGWTPLPDTGDRRLGGVLAVSTMATAPDA